MKQFTVGIQEGGRPSAPMSLKSAKQYVNNISKLTQLSALMIGQSMLSNNVKIIRVNDLDVDGVTDVPKDATEPRADYRQGSVSYDGVRAFDCYLPTNNASWNGHAMPVFDTAQLDVLIRVLRADNHVDIGTDNRLYIAHVESQHDVMVVLPQTVRLTNDKPATVWAVGSSSWTWAEQPKLTRRLVKFRATSMTELLYTTTVTIPEGVNESDYLDNYQRELDGSVYESSGSDGDWDNAGFSVMELNSIKVSVEDGDEVKEHGMRYIDCDCGQHGNSDVDAPPQNISGFDIVKDDESGTFTLTCSECKSEAIKTLDEVYEGE